MIARVAKGCAQVAVGRLSTGTSPKLWCKMHLLFSESGIGPEQLHVLVASLAGIKGGCLDTLELAGVLRSQWAALVSPFADRVSALLCVIVTGNDFGDEGLSCIQDVLPALPCLRSLDVSGNIQPVVTTIPTAVVNVICYSVSVIIIIHVYVCY